MSDQNLPSVGELSAASEQIHIPKEWAKFELDDISALSGGKTPSKSNDSFWNSNDVYWASPKDMKSIYLEKTADMISWSAVKEGGVKVYPDESILFVVRSGILKHTFPVCLSRVPTAVNQDLKVIEPSNTINTIFLLQLLRAKGNEFLWFCSKQGTTVDSIDVNELKKYELPLPPLAEQKVIADKLDTLLAQVESTKARLQRLPDILKRFRQSVLSAAVSGKLTEEWRLQNPDVLDASQLCKEVEADRSRNWNLKGKYKGYASISEDAVFSDIPKSWTLKSLDSLTESNRPICYGILMPKENVPDGVLYVKVRDIKKNQISVSNLQRTSFQIAEKYERSKLSAGDLLVTIRGTYGKIVKVPPVLDGGNVTQDTARVSVHSRLNSSFVIHVLRSEEIQKFFQDVSRGVAVKGVNIGDLRTTPIPVPALDEQTEIVRRVEALFQFADQIEQKVNAALERVNNLTQSVLAKAFRGELTADWRAQNPDLISGENSAEALLEKIKAEREKLKPKKKTARKKAKA